MRLPLRRLSTVAPHDRCDCGNLRARCCRRRTDYVVKSCWIQFTGDSWDNVAESKAFTTIAGSEMLSKARATTGR